MQYRIDFKVGEKVFYCDPTHSVPVRIVRINTDSAHYGHDERFTVRVISRRYHFPKGAVFTTSGNFLRKSKPPITQTHKRANEKGAMK